MENPPAWHVDPVYPEDDAKLRDLMRSWSTRHGERATKQGTLRRVVREAWAREHEEDR